ncbi:MAG: hypothetical protein RLP15_11555 [Cryomorphaceae bacterium]
MHQIWRELVDHVKADYKLRPYLVTALFLGILLFVNYAFEVEKNLLGEIGSWQYLWFNALVFFVTYYAAVWIKVGAQPFASKGFLVSSFVILCIATLSSSLLFIRECLTAFSYQEQRYLARILFNSIGTLVVFSGLGMLYFFRDRGKVEGFYGLRLTSKQNLLPYFGLLTLMLPLLFWASTQAHFLETYPIFNAAEYKAVFGLTLHQMTALFEGLYLLDFIRIELLFRGALVIGLSRFLGKDAVLPMVVMYCMLHINKPLGEAISSIFGGYVLGVIALYQRHIIGGCIVHIGVAGLMELLAYWASS